MKYGERSMYNFKQRVTKSNNLVLLLTMCTILPKSAPKIWNNYDHVLYILCKYVIQICV